MSFKKIPKGFKKAEVSKFDTEMVNSKENQIIGNFLKIIDGLAYHCNFEEATHYVANVQGDKIYAAKLPK